MNPERRKGAEGRSRDFAVAAGGIDSAGSARTRLAKLGVWREMRAGRIDVPDIFRLGFRLARRGGVPLRRDGEVR